MAMHPCERVDLDFIDSAPFRFVSTVDLTITPVQLFEVLDDAESWPQWATAITKVTWTSPEVVPVFVEFEVAVPHLRPAGW